jgi:hypothetical protein
MGLFDFLRSKKQQAPKQGVTDEVFNSSQFRTEILAFALWKFNANGSDYARVKAELLNPENQLGLNEDQASEMVETLKQYIAKGA